VTVAIGQRARDRLHHAPDELRDRHRQADADDTEPGCSIERRHEQPERLARAHRDHQHGGGEQGNTEKRGG